MAQYPLTPEERAARRLESEALKGKRRRVGESTTRKREPEATRSARALDRKLGIAPQKKTRASRMLARERRKAMRGDAPSHPRF